VNGRESHWRRRLRAELHTVRSRVLFAVLGFMAAGLLVAGATTHALQLQHLNDQVSQELGQHGDALRALADAGADHAPDQPFASVHDLFTAFLQGGAPGGYESVATMIDGEIALVPPGQQKTDLNSEQVLTAVNESFRPGVITFRDIEVDGSAVRLAMISVNVGADPSQGILLVSNAIGEQREQIFDSLGHFTVISLATLLCAGVVGFLVTGRLLVPVKRLREATEAATFDDLTMRVDIPDGSDDLTLLAQNFNHMLERLEAGSTSGRRFVDDVGHELRTPLTIIRGYMELVDPQDPADVEQTRDVLLDEMDRMQRLVDDLLILAKTGRPDFVRPEWVEVGTFVESVMDRVKVLGPRNWHLDQTASGRIWADRQRLTQAIEQLAANAVKFGAEGDTVAIGARWAPEGHTLQLWVRDTGRGIPPEDQQRIFERFNRGVGETVVEGTGLGLPIVKAIAEAHGGRVTLDSAVGDGATFTLCLPENHPGAGPTEPEPAGRTTPQLQIAGGTS
jgi:two-component system, OmpR family, sensor kinase